MQERPDMLASLIEEVVSVAPEEEEEDQVEVDKTIDLVKSSVTGSISGRSARGYRGKSRSSAIVG